jgi:thioredoxin reductase
METLNKSNGPVYDIIIISTGPYGLTITVYLCEYIPFTIFTDKEY